MVHYLPIDLYGLKLQEIRDDLSLNRNKLRQLIIKKLWEENSGQGRQEKAAHYVYYVEKLDDLKRIFLTRSARQRQGFDYSYM